MNKMKGQIRRIQTIEFKLSILLVVIISFLLPGRIVQDGSIIEYVFGFPTEYWAIYQRNEISYQLFYNLFNGNSGMNFNILGFFINIVIIYCLLLLIKKIYKLFLKCS